MALLKRRAAAGLGRVGSGRGGDKRCKLCYVIGSDGEKAVYNYKCALIAEHQKPAAGPQDDVSELHRAVLHHVLLIHIRQPVDDFAIVVRFWRVVGSGRFIVSEALQAPTACRQPGFSRRPKLTIDRRAQTPLHTVEGIRDFDKLSHGPPHTSRLTQTDNAPEEWTDHSHTKHGIVEMLP